MLNLSNETYLKTRFQQAMRGACLTLLLTFTGITVWAGCAVPFPPSNYFGRTTEEVESCPMARRTQLLDLPHIRQNPVGYMVQLLPAQTDPAALVKTASLIVLVRSTAPYGGEGTRTDVRFWVEEVLKGDITSVLGKVDIDSRGFMASGILTCGTGISTLDVVTRKLTPGAKLPPCPKPFVPRKPTLKNLQAVNQQTFEGQKRWVIQKGGQWAQHLDPASRQQFDEPCIRTMPFTQHAQANHGQAFARTFLSNTRYLLIFKEGVLYHSSNAGAAVDENVDLYPEWLEWVRGQIKAHN